MLLRHADNPITHGVLEGSFAYYNPEVVEFLRHVSGFPAPEYVRPGEPDWLDKHQKETDERTDH